MFNLSQNFNEDNILHQAISKDFLSTIESNNFIFLMQQLNKNNEKPVDTWIRLNKWDLIIWVFQEKPSLIPYMSNSAIKKILNYYHLAEIEMIEIENRSEIFLFKLITSWLYKANRKLSIDDKKKPVPNIIIAPEEISFLILTKLLSFLFDLTKFSFISLSDYMATIENNTSNYYASYLSDDSDSENENQFEKQEPTQQNKLKEEAKLILLRNEHVLFFERNSSSNPLRNSSTPPPKNRTINGVTVNAFNFRRKIYHNPSQEAKKDLEKINTLLLEGKSLAEASKKVDTKFFIAQYRGIHFRTTEFNQTARKNFRQENKIKKPLFSLAVHHKAGTYPFYKFYKLSAAEQENKRAKLITEAQALHTKILHMRCNSPFIKENYTYNAWFDWLQDQYSKNLNKFLAELGQGHFDWQNIKFETNKNIMVSTSNYPYHALLYAYGSKYYNSEKGERLRPRWHHDGRAERLHVGEVYTSLHPLADYNIKGPSDIPNLNKKGRVKILTNIVYEFERSFPVELPANKVIAVFNAKFPSFHRKCKQIFYIKYGFDEATFNKFKTLITDNAPHSIAAKNAQKLLTEWLCAFYEVKMIEQARKEAEQLGGVLVYFKEDGTLDFDPDHNNKIATGSSPQNIIGKNLISARREFREKLANCLNNPLKKEEVRLFISKNGFNEKLLTELFEDINTELDTLINNFSELSVEKKEKPPSLNEKFFGLRFTETPKDGHCLFHAMALYLNQDASSLRKIITAHMEKNFKYYKDFYPGNEDDFRKYIDAIRNTNEWAGHIEINIIQLVTSNPIIVIQSNANPIIPDNLEKYTGDPIFIYYNGHNHYDAFVLEGEKNPKTILREIQDKIKLGEVVHYNKMVQCNNNSSQGIHYRSARKSLHKEFLASTVAVENTTLSEKSDDDLIQGVDDLIKEIDQLAKNLSL